MKELAGKELEQVSGAGLKMPIPVKFDTIRDALKNAMKNTADHFIDDILNIINQKEVR
ncbi:hypothetical protein [Xenorhabdus innexi]|uniref:Uncharacterized protein n=1 Tax=Xenorhabdus innexi TaxID=290109 RepID=A0A1N6MWW3_9GAMM|nr:hypothetical protein [Xenorhabdus innexi]PHM33534.1 hypothetical protein Xinn_02351 [Xenorhabdus innexi]SIP73368.1 hypothetical protein XIS1_190005 [Xenorhabdus innexi]